MTATLKYGFGVGSASATWKALFYVAPKGNGQAFTSQPITTSNRQKAVALPLGSPHSGWEPFWQELISMGILDMPLTAGDECNPFPDGAGNLVEISERHTYRTYEYQEGNPRCAESQQLANIAKAIGLEFDSGERLCTTTEWFPCATYLQNYGESEIGD